MPPQSYFRVWWYGYTFTESIILLLLYMMNLFATLDSVKDDEYFHQDLWSQKKTICLIII